MMPVVPAAVVMGEVVMVVAVTVEVVVPEPEN